MLLLVLILLTFPREITLPRITVWYLWFFFALFYSRWGKNKSYKIRRKSRH